MTDTPEKLDLSPYRLLIVSPLSDGNVTYGFHSSMNRMVELLNAHGCKTLTATTRYCADISLARNKLFAIFYHMTRALGEPPTHMLSIDADMAWPPEAAAYMLISGHDFIGAAGCRKQYPLEFCLQQIDDYGVPVTTALDMARNILEVTALGGAFTMLSRNFAEKMVEAYPGLAYDGENHTDEWGIYDPLIINKGLEYPRRRLSDDYALCHRWRRIGGTVQCMLDVELQHTGQHTFTGNLYREMLAKDLEWRAMEERAKKEREHGGTQDNQGGTQKNQE
ncbi:MAG: hypothetical protein EPO08_20940 [Rhodospirillaceae bacterium]|nr:MAG: hypothetical protein EPO08_20940 [Rhodospirillaceae bacterium]